MILFRSCASIFAKTDGFPFNLHLHVGNDSSQLTKSWSQSSFGIKMHMLLTYATAKGVFFQKKSFGYGSKKGSQKKSIG